MSQERRNQSNSSRCHHTLTSISSLGNCRAGAKWKWPPKRRLKFWFLSAFFFFSSRLRRIIPTGIDFGGAGWTMSGMRAILSVGALSLLAVGKTFLQTDFGLGWDSGHGVLHTFWRMHFLLWAARNKTLPIKLMSLNKSHQDGQRKNNCVYVHRQYTQAERRRKRRGGRGRDNKS